MDSARIPKGLGIASTSESGEIVISVSGELDIATAPKLESELDGAIAGSPTAVYVDLSDVQFMDSTGLRLLIGAHRRLSEAGADFGVATGESPARRVIELTGMDAHMKTTRELAELTD